MTSDMKNGFLASFSSVTAFFTAMETQTLITIISAIVLPIVFFLGGKAIDVVVQIHLKKKADEREEDEKSADQ